MKLRPLRIGIITVMAFLGLRQESPGGEPTPPANAPVQDPTAVSYTRDVVPFLTKHCYSCHGNGKRKADLALDDFRDELAIQENREIWENVLEMVRTGEMPPKPRPRPADEEMAEVLEALDA